MRALVRIVAVTAAASVSAALTLGAVRAGGIGTALADPTVQYLLIVPVPFLAAGIWLLRRHPDHRTGWLLVGATAGTMAYAGLLEQAVKGRVPETGVEPWMSAALAVEAIVTMAGLACFALLLALFPGGRPRVDRERWFARAVWSFPALMVVAVLANEHVPVDPVAYGAMDPFPNPFHVEALAWLGPPTASLRYALGLSLVVAIGVLLLRYREVDLSERRQIRWVLYGSLVALTVGIVPFVLEPLLAPDSVTHGGLLLVGTSVLLLIPASIVVAVEQPRWIDTDEVIRKSFAYGVLTIGIFVVYGSVAAGLGMAAGARLPLEAAIVITAALAFLFQPTRARLQLVADRWVFGDRPTPMEAVAGFDEAIRDADGTDVGARLADLVRAAARLHWAAVEIPPDPVHVAGRPMGEPALRIPIRHGEETFGEIRCGPRIGSPLSGEDEDLVNALAGQAGLLLANVRLAARIVHAQEAERRRIERNIHDGAQQELVALVAKLGLARERARAGTLDEEVLVELQRDAGAILRDLRELAQGIHPSVLTDGGLVEAVEDRCSRLPIRVAVVAAPELRSRRFHDEVEGAAYFFVAEGLANVLKHADATAATVRLDRGNGHLELSVADDGRGFDPGAVRHGGLAGLSDRFAALSGTVSVDARPGSGTVLRALLPVERS